MCNGMQAARLPLQFFCGSNGISDRTQISGLWLELLLRLCAWKSGSVEAIIRALNAAEVEYLIVGGLAVNAHGLRTAHARRAIL